MLHSIGLNGTSGPSERGGYGDRLDTIQPGDFVTEINGYGEGHGKMLLYIITHCPHLDMVLCRWVDMD